MKNDYLVSVAHFKTIKSGRTYKFIQIDGPCANIWGTFCNDRRKMFLFASYLLGTVCPETFWIYEEDTAKWVKLIDFCKHYGITKDDIKKV